jgi:hypothetical protein
LRMITLSNLIQQSLICPQAIAVTHRSPKWGGFTYVSRSL